jgi:hypothetical protein
MVRLSAEHLRQYETDGYLIIENCASHVSRPAVRPFRSGSGTHCQREERATWADASTAQTLSARTCPHCFLTAVSVFLRWRLAGAGFPEETRQEIVEAMRSWVPPRPIPENAFVGSSFPYEHQIFNDVTTDPDLLEFIAAALGSANLHMRLAHNWVRFPGNDPQGPENEAVVQKYKHGGGTEGTTRQRFGGFHVDNGNNSLVPPTHDRRLGQISSWYVPEAVDESQAPMLVVPKHKAPADSSVQPDKSDAIALCVPANTLMIFVRTIQPLFCRLAGPIASYTCCAVWIRTRYSGTARACSRERSGSVTP